MWYVVFDLHQCVLRRYCSTCCVSSFSQDESEQGRIQGALYSLQALASGIGPVILRYVQHISQDSFMGPGAMFIFAGGLYLVAVVTACLLPKEKANSQKQRGTGLTVPLSLEEEMADLMNDSELAALMDDTESSLYGSTRGSFLDTQLGE